MAAAESSKIQVKKRVEVSPEDDMHDPMVRRIRAQIAQQRLDERQNPTNPQTTRNTMKDILPGMPPPDLVPVKKKGGMVEGMDKAQDTAMLVKAFKQHDAQEHKGGKGTTLKLAKGGSASSRADGIAQRGKTRGKMC
jgi:hypothetical protein